MIRDAEDWNLPQVSEQVRRLKVDLADEGLALFPSSAVGQRAHALWHKIRAHLLRGGSVQITPSALGLSWHRQELKRARDVLLEMRLVRPRTDGCYVLGRYDRLDELARERFLELKLLERLMVGLSGVIPKSKTQ